MISISLVAKTMFTVNLTHVHDYSVRWVGLWSMWCEQALEYIHILVCIIIFNFHVLGTWFYPSKFKRIRYQENKAVTCQWSISYKAYEASCQRIPQNSEASQAQASCNTCTLESGLVSFVFVKDLLFHVRTYVAYTYRLWLGCWKASKLGRTGNWCIRVGNTFTLNTKFHDQ